MPSPKLAPSGAPENACLQRSRASRWRQRDRTVSERTMLLPHQLLRTRPILEKRKVRPTSLGILRGSWLVFMPKSVLGIERLVTMGTASLWRRLLLFRSCND